MKYSNRTIAELCRGLGHIIRSNAELETLFIEYGLSYRESGGGIQPHANVLVTELSRQESDQALTQLVEYVLHRHHPGNAVTERLLQSLSLDGFEWQGDQLVPTTPHPAALANELSQLEHDLDNGMMIVAARHYRQAHESFTASNWEAANGQIRSFMENLLIELGKRETSKMRSDPSAALQDLRNKGFIS